MPKQSFDRHLGFETRELVVGGDVEIGARPLESLHGWAIWVDFYGHGNVA